MSEVIRKEYVICSEDYLASKPKDDDKRKAALRKIFCAGWLHTEIRADIDGILYTFASPLHSWCIDWKLSRLPWESRIVELNLSEFALAVIQRFSRQSLEKREIGPKAQSIPEAQFQDEFYSASSKHANGSVSSLEFGTKNGRIDFFIRSKKWSVEFLRDRNWLGQHARRFTKGEYGLRRDGCLTISLLIFVPGIPRSFVEVSFLLMPVSYTNLWVDVDKLIYVVSVDDWDTIEVLDNKGGVIHQYSLLNNS